MAWSLRLPVAVSLCSFAVAGELIALQYGVECIALDLGSLAVYTRFGLLVQFGI
jgi:hypothetical protein